MRIRPLTLVLIVALMSGACGDSDSSGASPGVPIREWVAEFDRLCVETATQLSDPTLTDTEFQDVSNEAIAEMRAIGTPSANVEEANTLLDVLDAQTNDATLSSEEIAELDERFLAAAQTLEISDECLYGAPG